MRPAGLVMTLFLIFLDRELDKLYNDTWKQYYMIYNY